eukprot:1763555-Pyramimonas_sp.AAC.1
MRTVKTSLRGNRQTDRRCQYSNRHPNRAQIPRCQLHPSRTTSAATDTGKGARSRSGCARRLPTRLRCSAGVGMGR